MSSITSGQDRGGLFYSRAGKSTSSHGSHEIKILRRVNSVIVGGANGENILHFNPYFINYDINRGGTRRIREFLVGIGGSAVAVCEKENQSDLGLFD